jgi:hypothetical protein
MINKNVPFYSNTPDDTHCYQASLRMVLKYFLPEKDYSWKKLDEFTAKKEGLWTWPTQAHMNLIKMGFDVIDMDYFDNQRFAREGGKYLIEKFGEEVGKKQIERSDLDQEVRLMKEYETFQKHQMKLPTFETVKKALDDGYLVICNVNSYALDNETGYSGHFVVVYGYDDGNLYLHDPGLPGKEARKISFDQFLKAWDYPDKNARNMTGFKYGKN